MPESLFKLSKRDKNKSPVFSAEVGMEYFYSSPNSKAELLETIGKLEPGKCKFTFAHNKWSNHELLAYLLEQTGPAEVFITSWSITEAPMQKLTALVESGHITSLRCLFSDRVPVMSPNAHQVMTFNKIDIKLGKCHAKIIAIRNKDWGVVAIGSANFTNNPRWEAGVVCPDKTVCDMYISGIKKAIEDED